MTGLRLSSLTVKAFRGIANPVTFDLSAPLTLVFAPNGSGKTTMCEAAEWLLTNQVERLRDGRDLDPGDLRSKFFPERSVPTVKATLEIGGEQHFLSRSADGAQVTARFGTDEASATDCRLSDLLARLAPAAAADEAHYLTAISLRQRWLKGTRFLSSEALAALIDTDEDMLAKRTQIFADLLGVRHLLDAEQLCVRYAKELTSRVRLLDAGIAGEEAQSLALEAELSSANAPPVGLVSARTELLNAHRLLAHISEAGPVEMPGDDVSVDTVLQSVTALHQREAKALDERAELLGVVEASWQRRDRLVAAVDDLQRLDARLAERLKRFTNNAAGWQARRAEQIKLRDILVGRRSRAAAAKAEVLDRSLAIDWAMRQPHVSLDPSLTFDQLRKALREAAWAKEIRDVRLAELARLEDDLEQAPSEAARLKSLQDQQEKLFREGLDEKALAELRAATSAAEAAATSAQSTLASMLQPVERIQSAARELLSHMHSDKDGWSGECPLCASDWGSVEGLRAAIEAVLAGGPQVSLQARTSAVAASSHAADLRVRLNSALSIHDQLQSLAEERRSLEARVNDRAQRLRSFGLDANDAAGSIRTQRAHLLVASALAGFQQAWAEHGPALAGEAQPGHPKVPVAGLHEWTNVTGSAREQAIEAELAIAGRAIALADRRLERLARATVAANQRLASVRLNCSEQVKELRAFEASWKRLFPDADWSETLVSDLRTKLEQTRSTLADAFARIEAGRAAWSAESRRIRLLALRDSLEPKRVERARWTVRLAAAERARDAFLLARQTIGEKQVRGLDRVVNPLFARMHANRVYDCIDLGEGGEFPQWRADAGEEVCDPGKHFSQGQRQDLALAIFLARARGLGGTFFLDEPVIHLDDLNRVGLLDILRAVVLENSRRLNLVITTSSRGLARHMIEKFASVGPVPTPAGEEQALRVLELEGNGRTEVTCRVVYPAV